ncbi:transcriptional regulator [Komagataeibacter diospyri]|uniref:AraC family transcriptional regulator n=1 Tax=Komagataeibacter diospyri TaxID=1932662 RepID=UPI001134075E|nr:AraC family transcriptional regulator [Komagataeibacter diospyri]GCE88575.1 transcriptional regulator [Komagataeibacter diospyri]
MSSSLARAVTCYLDGRGCGTDGLFTTSFDGLNIIRLSGKTSPNGMVYKPSLCITLQGAKEVEFGDAIFAYGAMGFLLVSVEMPALSRVTQASHACPYIGITLDLDAGILREVMTQLTQPPLPSNDQGIGVFVAELSEDLADCVRRLIRLFDNPMAPPVLWPAIMREICFWLLTGPHAGEVCKLVLPDSHLQRVAEAIHLLRANFTKPVRIEHLAAVARMSLSSFHQHFKTLTSMTPLQYQKQLRLLEARRLMVSEDVNVSHAAFEVGYESASQFSRDYVRRFGIAPKRDVMELRSFII